MLSVSEREVGLLVCIGTCSGMATRKEERKRIDLGEIAKLVLYVGYGG